MEKYSFLKYINIQEKKYKNKIAELNNQIGGVNNIINIKTIQEELLKTRLKLEEISSRKTDSLINPYNTLKELIDKINKNIEIIDINKDSLSDNDIEMKKREIINKINNIDILLDSDPRDYNKIITSTKLNYIGERINPKEITAIITKYIDDTQGLVNEAKSKIGGNIDEANGDTLYENSELFEIYDQINNKLIEFKEKITPFEQLTEKINMYINQMNTITNITLDSATKPTDVNEQNLLIDVESLDEGKEELDTTDFKITDDKDIDTLISSSFLSPSPTKSKYLKQFSNKYLNESKIEELQKKIEITGTKTINGINELFLEWKKKIIEYKEKLLLEKEKLDREKPVIEKPVIEKPVIEKPVIEKQVIEKPVIEENEYDNCLNELKKYLIEKDSSRRTILESKTKSELIIILKDEISKILNLNKRLNKITDDDLWLEICLNKISIQKGGTDKKTLIELIDQLNIYEKEVIKMKKIRKELEKNIKIYNLRYVQYFNFQKYIVNYVSLKVAEGGYSYYQFVSKGLISYYQSLLQKLTDIFEKFDKYKGSSKDTQDPINQWFYGKHYYMIITLKNFLDALYELWDKNEKIPEQKEAWNFEKKQFKTDEYNKHYWFLFNIFIYILDEYNMKLPSIANYIRINKIVDKEIKKQTFNKNGKNSLHFDNLSKCTENNANNKAQGVSNIKFEEVFDEQFTNDNLSSYMGLSNFLKRGKSIMILTYGYSGVGKSFTLFGKQGTNGMLQSTLKLLGSNIQISVKAFELYGLGVPYKFYWQNPEKFSHAIYAYKIKDNEASVETPNKYINDDMKKFLDINNNEFYTNINSIHIDNFNDIVSQIDTIRKENGRIKATINNPESSRSIMIYDFKIILKDGNNVNFVIMDLPGKENLYQTYCETNDPNFKLKDKYLIMKDEESKKYNEELIKSMVFINPLWLSLVPETAMHFDNLNSNKHITLTPTLDNIPVFGKYYMDSAHSIINFTTQEKANQHLQFQLYTNNNSDYNKQTSIKDLSNKKAIENILGLTGLTERSMFKIVNLIQYGKLEELGNYLNSMLDNEESRNKKYGFAGLEGIYINENILGLLQVLSNRITEIKGKENVKVVCTQNEIYRQTQKDKHLHVNTNIQNKPVDVNNVEDDEFYSQIMYLSDYSKKSIGNLDKYKELNNNKKDGIDDNQYYVYSNIRNKDEQENIKTEIKGYDYNKIFNIEEPPIKTILSPYLEKIDNFYMFFVVSNNLKQKGDHKIETCDKQLQLLSDTQAFMNIISAKNDEDFKNVQCSN